MNLISNLFLTNITDFLGLMIMNNFIDRELDLNLKNAVEAGNKIESNIDPLEK